MKLGIIQGRLLPPVNGKIQEFPKIDWEKEFIFLKDLDLNHIEFIVTKDSLRNFLELEIEKYSNFISGVCCDNLIDPNFHSMEFLKKNLIPICNKSLESGIKNINIPLLEESSLSESNFKDFSESILDISSNYPQINFNFEIESPVDLSLKLVNLSDNFFFIYDTGNLNFIGVDHNDYIKKIIHKISNVHLKDRDRGGSHFPGQGKTNFKLIFNLLHQYNYDNYFTIQTKRGVDGQEIQNIFSHSEFFKTLWFS